MSLWDLNKSDVAKALFILYGNEVKSFYIPSGLYLWLTLKNGEVLTITDNMINQALKST